MFNSRGVTTATILLALLTITGCIKVREGVEVLRLAHGLDTTHPVHLGMVRMAERLEEKSSGTLIIKIYPGEQLGDERETLELLQIGSLAMTKVSASVIENFDPSYQVFGLPYLFRDDVHRFAVLDGEIGKELMDSTAKYRFRGVCYYDAGTRSFYTTLGDRPIHSPDDLVGLKVRVQPSPMAMTAMKALGASPTPVSWGELYTALQQGVVDAAENNPPTFVTSRHFEVCTSLTLDEHTAVPDVLLISELVWKSLTDEERKWVKEAAMESVVYQRSIWQKSSEESLRTVEEAGLEVIRPDKQPFQEKVQGMYEELQTQNPELAALADRIRRVNQ
ncbi:MAG TPA: TRAP transporter substrate-binding protein [Acidobacteriota bacterium]|nr:TRAP transporter substrate-binding protein [Acidobacteriota bacterium]